MNNNNNNNILQHRHIKRAATISSYNTALFFSSSSASSEEEEDTIATPAVQRTLAKQPILGSSSTGIGSNDDNDDSDSNNNSNSHLPYHVYESEQTIKKSRFIALTRYADNWKDASDFVQEIKTKVHPKARHWCFAYRGSIVGDGGNSNGGGDSEEDDDDNNNMNTLSLSDTTSSSTTITERASDDGEPSGTAGQPILNALQTEGGLIDVVLVVIRYSGGIKLGAGGLIRAYGGTARQVLQEFAHQQIEVIPKQTLQLSAVQPKYVGVVYDLAAKYSATVNSNDYVTFSFTCDFDDVQTISERLMDATRGSVVIR